MRELWTNWAGNQGCITEVVEPRTLDELRTCVREAALRGPIRPAGGSYSWSPLVPTSGTIVKMGKLNRILGFGTLEGRPYVEVEAGVILEDLTTAATARGLTLVSPTLFPWPTIGGAIGAGAHGNGLASATFSDDVLEATLVDANGEVRTFDARSPEMPAVRVSLGTLGILYSVKLALAHEYRLDVIVRPLPIDEVLATYADLVATYDYVEMMWFPFQPTIWVRLGNPTRAPADRITLFDRVVEKADAGFEQLAGRYLLPFVARRMPAATPALLRLSNSAANQAAHLVQTSAREFHHQKAYPKAWDMSFSVPLEKAAEAWKMGIDLVDDFRRRGEFPANMSFFSRCVGASSAYLSPAEGRKSCFVESATTYVTPGIDGYYRELWNRWMSIPGARPHWGKRWEIPAQIPARFPKMAEFRRVRDELDPGRVFLDGVLDGTIF